MVPLLIPFLIGRIPRSTLIPQALRYFERAGHADNQAATINNIGNVFFLTNRYDSADVYYRRALHLVTDSMRVAHTLKNLADNFYYQNQLDSAMHYIRASLCYPIWPKSYPYHLYHVG